MASYADNAYERLKRKGHAITFDVLYHAQSTDKVNRMVEIGENESEFIRMYHPIPNIQIP